MHKKWCEIKLLNNKKVIKKKATREGKKNPSSTSYVKHFKYHKYDTLNYFNFNV